MNEVIVVKGVRIGSMVGVLEDGVDPTVFRSVPYLQLVHSSPLFDVYRVRGSGGGQFPDPTTTAGFHCERGVVAGGVNRPIGARACAIVRNALKHG